MKNPIVKYVFGIVSLPFIIMENNELLYEVREKLEIQLREKYVTRDYVYFRKDSTKDGKLRKVVDYDT